MTTPPRFVRPLVAVALAQLMALSMLGVVSWSRPAVAGESPPAAGPTAAPVDRAGGDRAERAAGDALRRLAGDRIARQVDFDAMTGAGEDTFRVSARGGRVHVEGTSAVAMLTGFDWYLKHVAQADIAITGEQLDLPKRLPLPGEPIVKTSAVTHRFALNDTNEGYTNPYQTWADWQRHIDVLALRGVNEALVYVGQESVYYETLQKFGYTAEQMRAWIPNPAHQPWWLLQNLCCHANPITERLMDQRVALGRKIADRMRELGMTPVFPGYYGTVPTDFETQNPGAHTVPQGDWAGFERPDWLDPTTPLFADVAAEFYRVQDRLFGATGMYKMDLLHEGGTAGDVPVGEASAAVQDALAAAHPEAIWAILGWFDNPLPETLAAIDKSKVLIVDGTSDFVSVRNREQHFAGTPYAFGTIWNFGGHRNLGADIMGWNRKYFRWLSNPDTSMDGIALMPEAIDNNPAATEFFTELAWHDGPVNLRQWFTDYAVARYGGVDQHAINAWRRMLHTTYTWPDDWGSKYATGLYELPPGLGWEGTILPYERADFDVVLTELLKVAPALRDNAAYRYDVVDVARQVLANDSAELIAGIRAAYQGGNLDRFRVLTGRWMHRMQLLDEVLGSNEHFLLGDWLRDARRRAGSQAEADLLEYDARQLITTWGTRPLADYAAREWSGLMGDYYASRWRAYFETLEQALEDGTTPEEIDWFEFGEAWAHEDGSYPVRPSGNAYQLASQVRETLANDPDQVVTLDVTGAPGVLETDGAVTVTATVRNGNGFVPASDVEVTLDQPAGLDAEAETPTSYDRLAAGGDVEVRWTVTVADGATIDDPLARFDVTTDYRFGTRTKQAAGAVSVLVPSTEPGEVYLSDLPFVEAINGWGPVERDLHNGETAQGDGGPLVIEGVTYEKGLGTNSNADVRFDLGGLCTSFSSVIDIDDTMTVEGKDPDVIVKVFAGDTMVFESELIDQDSAPVMLDVDLDRPQALRLVVEQYDQDFYFDRLDFADAKVTCSRP